jgi:hypothetical protein
MQIVSLKDREAEKNVDKKHDLIKLEKELLKMLRAKKQSDKMFILGATILPSRGGSINSKNRSKNYAHGLNSGE